MAKLNISSKLKAGTAPAKKRASDRPVLSSKASLVDKLVAMKKELVDKQMEYEQTERQLTEGTYGIYDDQRKNGNYASSIFAEGKDSNGLMVVYSDKYSAFPVEMEEDLRKADPKYDEHFVEVRDLKVKKDAGKTVSDEAIEKLMKALGEDEFFKIFDIKQTIGARKGLAERFHELPELIRSQMKQAEPSVRNVTEDGKVV